LRIDLERGRFAASLLAAAALLAEMEFAAATPATATPPLAPALATSAAAATPGTATDAVVADAAPQQLPPVQIQGHYVDSIGSSDASSAGVVTSKLLESRPTLRPAEVLEFVPGVIVTQHSGDGKANQYFLRGFNLDHGTDFATFVDGMPVNMPTNAHGQGYSDLNWLIPELVDRIAYRKGPYGAEEGDFASAGSARISLFDRLPCGIASLTSGEDGYVRALFANSNALETGSLLYAVEAGHNDGPWDNPEKFHRLNGIVRYAFGDDRNRSSITAMGYAAAWDSTDQIPLRAVASGLIDRFGAIDPTDGGQTSRYSLSYRTEHRFDDGELRIDAYAIRSSLDLFSDFTYFLVNPVGGDQFEQAEQREVFGLASRRAWHLSLGGFDSTTTLGLQIRHDRLDPVGLYSTIARVRETTMQESRVRETSVALYAENQVRWTTWLRSVAGLRGDRFRFDVASSIPGNSGQRSAGLGSPKLSLIFGPWARTEYFVNYGEGFHSNDARGTVETVTPKEDKPTEPVTPLVRSKGGELGLRTQIVPGLQSSLALWQLGLGSELVYSGDAGDTEPSRASRRSGIEWNNHWIATSWLLLDADVALSRARFTQHAAIGDHIPGSLDQVASLGATVADRGPWFGQFQLRYFGPRPLIEDDSVRSKSTTLAYLRVGYKIAPNARLTLDVFNLLNRQASDVDYYYVSRLRGEPAAGVADIHFHPVEPRRLRIMLTANF
jgi:outer membrane receptor protein involved in Fe transport